MTYENAKTEAIKRAERDRMDFVVYYNGDLYTLPNDQRYCVCVESQFWATSQKSPVLRVLVEKRRVVTKQTDLEAYRMAFPWM